MESKDLLISVINNLTNALDSVGFYVFDYNLVIDSPKSLTDIDELRKAAINKQAVIRFNLDAFISSSVWKAFTDPSTGFFGIELIPLADIFDIDDEEI